MRFSWRGSLTLALLAGVLQAACVGEDAAASEQESDSNNAIRSTQEVRSGEYPGALWLHLPRKKSNDFSLLAGCGGVQLRHNYILTNRHCTRASENGLAYDLQASDSIDVSMGKNLDSRPRPFDRFTVTRVWPSPTQDLAVLEVDRALPGTGVILHVGWPVDTSRPATVVAAGSGLDNKTGVMRKADIMVTINGSFLYHAFESSLSCNSPYGDPGYVIGPGDSGAALYQGTDDYGRPQVRGIVQGAECGDKVPWGSERRSVFVRLDTPETRAWLNAVFPG
jgi:hypothetical protein